MSYPLDSHYPVCSFFKCSKRLNFVLDFPVCNMFFKLNEYQVRKRHFIQLFIKTRIWVTPTKALCVSNFWFLQNFVVRRKHKVNRKSIWFTEYVITKLFISPICNYRGSCGAIIISYLWVECVDIDFMYNEEMRTCQTNTDKR